MNKYYPLVLIMIVTLCVSCGKAPVSEKKKSSANILKISNEESDAAKGDTKLVDADEFSKAFSATVHQPPPTSLKAAIDDGSKFFKSGDLVQNRFNNQEFQKCVSPESSMAGMVGAKTKYSWLPHWSFSGKGGVRIPSSAISEDKSLIAVLENVSVGDGITSTVLVLINTYNFNINAIYYFPGKLLSKIKFLPATPAAIVWEESRESENSGVLHAINLRTGKITASSQIVHASTANFAVNGDGTKMVLKTGNRKKNIYLFDLENLGQMPKSIDCVQEEGAVAISKDDSFFALAGRTEIEVFKFSDNMKLKDIKVNLKSVPDDFLFIGNNIFAMLSYMQPFFLVADNIPKQLSALAGRKLFFRDDIKAIVFEEYKNKAISIIDLKSLQALDSFSPEKLKPKTKGGAVLLTYLPHHKKYLLLDNQGNLSLFVRPGKRWRKDLIFSAEK